MQPAIRIILPREYRAVKQLRLQARSEFPHFFGTTHAEEMVRPDAELQHELANGAVHGIWHDQVLAGIAGYFVSPLSQLKHRANLYGLYAHPDIRRRGAMCGLLQHMIQAMPTDITVLAASVVCQNLAAQGMLEKLGFSAYATERRAMRDAAGEYHDLVLLQRDRV